MMGKRVNITLDDDSRLKLKRLSIACEVNPTTLANQLIKLCLNNVNIIQYIQKQHKVEERWRVNARMEGDQIIYD